MKQIIVFMGGPGSGKGTVAAPLLDGCELRGIEMGAMLRALPPDSEILEIIATGDLPPDSEIFKIIQPELDTPGNLLLDGFPRTLPQAQWLVENYADTSDIKIIYLDIPHDVMRERIKKRHASGSRRADDCDDTVINRRIKNFEKQTMPAIEWLQTCPDVEFINIDGTPPPNAVFKQIQTALK